MARAGLHDFAGSEKCLREALALAKAFGADSLVSSINIALADNEFLSGNSQAALRLVEEVLAASRVLRDPHATASALSDMALYLMSLGRYEKARASSNEALDLAREFSLPFPLARSLRYLAGSAILRHQAEHRPTRVDYASAAEIFGFANARISALGSADQDGPVYDRALGLLRDELGLDELTRLIAEGATMTEDEAANRARALE
jgi:tetratricopeptide (TPR) repeat protein